MVSNLLLGRRNFFNDQTRHWIPACLTIGVPIPCTISNVDSNSDFALVYVVTVALNEAGSVVVFVFISDPQHCVNRQGTTTLRSIESDEPSLAAAATPWQIEVSMVNNTEGSVILGFIEGTILQRTSKPHYWFSCLLKRPFSPRKDTSGQEDTILCKCTFLVSNKTKVDWSRWLR